MDKVKQCTKCRKIKPVVNFRLDHRTNKHHSWCKECDREYARIYRVSNPDRCKKATKKYCKNNRELLRQKNARWRKDNPQKSKNAKRKWYRKKRNKITECFYSRINENLKHHIERKQLWKILGYTYRQLCEHIESQFQNGMNWENHGDWEFDHIIPISHFNYKSTEDEEFKACWKLENIQPLWKQINHIKSNRILCA